MEHNAKLTGIQWRKSSYSGDQGGNCVECGLLGHLAWRKSSHSSDQGGNCLEVAQLPSPTATIAIRDSKVPSGANLAVTPAAFTTFVNWASARH